MVTQSVENACSSLLYRTVNLSCYTDISIFIIIKIFTLWNLESKMFCNYGFHGSTQDLYDWNLF